MIMVQAILKGYCNELHELLRIIIMLFSALHIFIHSFRTVYYQDRDFVVAFAWLLYSCQTVRQIPIFLYMKTLILHNHLISVATLLYFCTLM